MRELGVAVVRFTASHDHAFHHFCGFAVHQNPHACMDSYHSEVSLEPDVLL